MPAGYALFTTVCRQYSFADVHSNLGTFGDGITLYNLVQFIIEKERSTQSFQEALENLPRYGTKSKVKFEAAKSQRSAVPENEIRLRGCLKGT